MENRIFARQKTQSIRMAQAYTRNTYLFCNFKIGLRVSDAVSRSRHLTFEFVPIFFQFANRILYERLDVMVAVAYILGCVDEYIDALIQ